MPWNPFKAIGNAIGRAFGREEVAPSPQPERQPEARERGWFGRAWDRATGAEHRREEAERERQVQERERQVQERERQLVERERQVTERERAVSPAPIPERELPKFVGGGVSDYIERDERAFGTDSQIERDLQDAVDDFIMERGGLDGLSVDAREWLQSPTVSEVFAGYWQSGGFTADQVLAGMTSISNIQIVVGEDGDIDIGFDYEADVDGYEVSGHAS